MIFAPAATASAPDVEAAESYTQEIPTQLIANVEPSWLKQQQYIYRRTVLPIEGGRVLLRLIKTPIVQVDPVTQECEVLGWGVRMPCEHVENLSREMAHRFLDLFSKADGARLTEVEKSQWMQILDQIDFVGFSVDRAAPHYLEGTLISLEPLCQVEWHDGEKQRIDRNAARSLSVLRAGDEFGAYVKLGKNNSVQSIERITLLSAEA